MTPDLDALADAPPVPIHVALSAVMREVSAVAKDDRNADQGFNFRGVDAVVNAVSPALRRHGVVVTPTVLDHTYGTVEVGQNRRPMGHVLVTVAYTFTGPAGDTIDATVIGEAFDAGDKCVPKAMSVAFRTALLQALCLPTDDLDPDATAYDRAARVADPDPEQVAACADLTAAVEVCETKDDGRRVWALIEAARLAREITDAQAATLRDALTARTADLLDEPPADWDPDQPATSTEATP